MSVVVGMIKAFLFSLELHFWHNEVFFLFIRGLIYDSKILSALTLSFLQLFKILFENVWHGTKFNFLLHNDLSLERIQFCCVKRVLENKFFQQLCRRSMFSTHQELLINTLSNWLDALLSIYYSSLWSIGCYVYGTN